jgi:hypothetical protein
MHKNVLVKVVAADAGENRKNPVFCTGFSLFFMLLAFYGYAGLFTPHYLSSSPSIYSVRLLIQRYEIFFNCQII